MTEIREFDPEFIRARSAEADQIYATEHASEEPMQSVLENNPDIYFVPPKRSKDWGNWEYRQGAYYDTTVASKHPYWKDKDLPSPTKDISRLRDDLLLWGYCMVEDAVSDAQVEAIRTRVEEQAEGERLAGIAQKTPSGQNINSCINKGTCFEGLIELHPNVIQGGALIEQLVTELLGSGWICNSLVAAIATQGGVPQALHQDQIAALDSKHPLSVNMLTAVTDMDETNGGTLVVPGSHLILAQAVRAGGPVGKLPPTINLGARAGTTVITDGRLLHSTGVNTTSDPRIVMITGALQPWMRQQENWMLTVRPEVLERASPKLLHRIGFQATNTAQTNEGHGFGAQGLVGEDAGALVGFRAAIDRHEYVRVGELSPRSTAEELNAAFTLREVVAKARSGGRSAPLGIGKKSGRGTGESLARDGESVS